MYRVQEDARAAARAVCVSKAEENVATLGNRVIRLRPLFGVVVFVWGARGGWGGGGVLRTAMRRGRGLGLAGLLALRLTLCGVR